MCDKSYRNRDYKCRKLTLLKGPQIQALHQVPGSRHPELIEAAPQGQQITPQVQHPQDWVDFKLFPLSTAALREVHQSVTIALRPQFQQDSQTSRSG